MQVAPAFWLGFYNTGVKASAVFLGQLAGVIITIYYQCRDEECMRDPARPTWFAPIDGIHPAIFAFLVNLGIVIILSFLPDMTLLKIPGEKLPVKMLAWGVDGEKRPWRFFNNGSFNPWALVFWAGFLSLCFTTPWWKSAAWEEVA